MNHMHPRLFRLTGFRLLLFSLHTLHAATLVDPTFRSAVAPVLRGTDGVVSAMNRQADGRIVIAGDFARVNGVRRLMADGAIDPAFDVGSGPDGLVRSVAA